MLPAAKTNAFKTTVEHSFVKPLSQMYGWRERFPFVALLLENLVRERLAIYQ